MKNKLFKRVLAIVLAVCLSISVMSIFAFAATNVKPEPSQNDAAEIPVEYFSSTFIDYDQTKTNQAAQDADNKSDTYSWNNKQSSGNNNQINHSDLITQDAQYLLTDYYISPKGSGQYYPAYVSKDGNKYTLYYLKDGEYIWVDESITDRPSTNYFVDKPSQDPGHEGGDGQHVETCGSNYRVCLYKYEPDNPVQQGKGFYFTGDTGTAGKPVDALLPLYSKTWGNNKTNGPAIPGGQVNGGNDPNNSGQDQDFYIYSGLAQEKLSESTNAPFSNDVNAAPGFFSTDATVGTTYRTVYTNVGVPYVYDEETGNYTLDSDKNGVYFANGNPQSNTNMKIADLPSAIQMNGDGTLTTGLAPFVNITSTTVDAAPSGRDSVGGTSSEKVKAYQMNYSGNAATAKEQLFAFGMVTEVKFQMTDDGKSPVNGEPVEFNFSGDDDVWVYIDGILALDIGGVHDAIKGNIDFTTGKVTVSAPHCRIGKVGDRATNPTMDNRQTVAELEQGNIYTKLGTTLTGFAAQGEHTLTIYYLERGEGKTNCMIKFNLPQRDTIEVTKKFDNSIDNNGKITPISADELARYGGREFGFVLMEDGEPVANKTYYVYDNNNNFIRSASTDANGHFLLRRNETARFLVDIGTNNSFQVIEDTLASGFRDPTWEYSSNVVGTTITAAANGFNGMIVTANGSNTAADTISFVCENYLDVDIPNPGVITQRDRIVIDYGLPITIKATDILKNDIIRGDRVILKMLDKNGNVATSYDGDYGTVVYSGGANEEITVDDTIKYTLNKQLTGIETLTYHITVISGEESTEGTGEILIMPATSMYYEESFSDMVSYSDGAVQWELQGTPSNEDQETGLVGTIDDSTYGSDVVYLNNLGDSYGTSMLANANDKYAAQFEYDFVGTGTAIYGRISNDTGYIRVTVTNSENESEDIQFIDTSVITDVGGNNTLYNIPIYHSNELPHGKYHVAVLLYRGGTPTDAGESGAEFYLDGIRIYNPVVNNTTVNTAYADDDEVNTVITNIRRKIIADTEKEPILNDKIFTLTDVNGTIIKGDEAPAPDGDIGNIDDYQAFGPNNEFYLNNTGTSNQVYTISFKLLNWDSQLYKLYLGMKAPSGEQAVVKIGDTEITLNNSTDCYYDISNYVQVAIEGGYSVGTVVISGKSGLVSLTNIKVTGSEKFEIIDEVDEGPFGGDIVAGEGEDIIVKDDTSADQPVENKVRMLYMVPTTFSLEEEASFTPESIKSSCSYSRLFKLATTTVRTSKDVDYITVNGERVNAVKLWDTNLFIYAKKANKGTTFEIVAYNTDGVASDAYTVTAQ